MYTGKYATRPKERPVFATHQSGDPGIYAKLESLNAKFLKRRDFPEICRFEHQKQQRIEEFTELEEIKESDTNKSIYISTERKHETDGSYHIKMTTNIDGTEKKIIVETGSPVTIISPIREIIKTSKYYR